MNNVKQLHELAVVFDRTKLFYLKRLVNSFVEANPVLKPMQKDIEHMFKVLKDEQARRLSLYAALDRTNDPMEINLINMNIDVATYERRA